LNIQSHSLARCHDIRCVNCAVGAGASDPYGFPFGREIDFCVVESRLGGDGIKSRVAQWHLGAAQVDLELAKWHLRVVQTGSRVAQTHLGVAQMHLGGVQRHLGAVQTDLGAVQTRPRFAETVLGTRQN